MKEGLYSVLEKRDNNRSDLRAFTRLELACLICAITVLLLVALPLLANPSLRSNQTGCLNNLRQIGVGFQAWGNDHEDRRPWFVPMNEGGSAAHPLRDNASIHFTFISNYVSPTVLVDPAETRGTKRVALNWTSGPGGFLNPSFGNNALSYMLGCHTRLAEANEILAGDRNVRFIGFFGCSYGFTQTGALHPLSSGWTNGAHGLAGNLLLNDGRVEFAGQDRLKSVLAPTVDDVQSSEHFLTPF